MRNVPDQVAEELERRAAAAGLSVNALAVSLLTEAAAVSRNDSLFAQMPDLGLESDEIVDIIREARDR